MLLGHANHEHASGGRCKRPALRKLIGTLRPGDRLVVWKLDPAQAGSTREIKD